MKLLIKDGFVISKSYFGNYDIEIINNKIVSVKKKIFPKKHKVIDAKNKIVIPGIIDAHVHFGLKGYGSKTLENFILGSKTALCNGITTVIDYVIPEKKENMIQALKRKLQEARKSFVDYTFHSQIVDFNKETPKQLKYIINSGIKSFKIFLPKTESWYIDNNKLYRILEELQKYKDVILEAHCEDSDIIEPIIKKLESKKKLDIKYFPLSRPSTAEHSAVKRFILYAKKFNTAIYIVHTSSKDAMKEIILWKKKKNKKFKLYAETCPQYLTFTDNVFKKNNNYLYTCCPAIKSFKDRKFLWESINNNFIDVIATDNCVFSKRDKFKNRNNFTKIPMGLPGTSILLRSVLSEGIKRKIYVKKLVELLTSNPAKIFGLYPKKGDFVKFQSDADVLIIKKTKEYFFRNCDAHTISDYSPYENMKYEYNIEKIIFKGKLVFDNNKLLLKNPKGIFLKR